MTAEKAAQAIHAALPELPEKAYMHAYAKKYAEALLTERAALMAELEVARAGLEKIIRMTRQTAHDQYGNAEKAESWSCVQVARAALAQSQGEAG